MAAQQLLGDRRQPLSAQHPRRNPLERVNQLRELDGRGIFDEQVDVVVLAVRLDQTGSEVATHNEPTGGLPGMACESSRTSGRKQEGDAREGRSSVLQGRE
jgi:hypothetical protein